jgi:hypothetical protein
METSLNALRLAVITGGHEFDVANFEGLFGRLAGVRASILALDEFAALPQAERDAFAAVLFYFMPTPKPDAQSRRWYTPESRAAVEHLRETGQGLVVLHHAILAYPDWPLWREVSGIDPTLERYDHDQTLRLRALEPNHPITAGLENFSVVDETYRMGEPDPGCEVLLVTDHPLSLESIAWVRTFGRSRVFCLALGHDHTCWSSPAFEQVLTRGLRWTVNG